MKKKILLSLILILWIVVVCEPAVSQVLSINQVKRDKVEWVPSTIKGITPGKSTYKDVIRLFGKPYYVTPLDCLPELQDKPETELGYNQKIKGVLARMRFIVDDETRIVNYISFYFKDKEMTKEDAIKIYGTDYYVITNSDYYNSTTREYKSHCVYKSQKRNQEVEVDVLNYPIKLVYPQKGMSIQIRSDNTVMDVEYRDKCNNP